MLRFILPLFLMLPAPAYASHASPQTPGVDSHSLAAPTQLDAVSSGVTVSDYTTVVGIPADNSGGGERPFRFQCKPSHASYDDPVVFPGTNDATHLHLFFGNRNTNENSTYASLRAAGEGTCQGGPLNRTGYWMPAMIRSGTPDKIVLPSFFTIYYKYSGVWGDGTYTQLPRGLRYIFGYNLADATTDGVVEWYCEQPVTGDETTKYPTFAQVLASHTCGSGGNLVVNLTAPVCWDGVSLDSVNHRSHLRVQTRWMGDGILYCPATHQYMITTLSIIAKWYHTGNADLANWYLSSDRYGLSCPSGTPEDGISCAWKKSGRTMHTDWYGAWEDSILSAWHSTCITFDRQCTGGNIGDGRQLLLNNVNSRGDDMNSARMLDSSRAFDEALDYLWDLPAVGSAVVAGNNSTFRVRPKYPGRRVGGRPN